MDNSDLEITIFKEYKLFVDKSDQRYPSKSLSFQNICLFRIILLLSVCFLSAILLRSCTSAILLGFRLCNTEVYEGRMSVRKFFEYYATFSVQTLVYQVLIFSTADI